MSTSIKVLLSSVVIGIIHAFYIFSRPVCAGEGLGCMGVELGPILLGVILIPVIFGIVGFIFSTEKKFTRALTWLGISFAVLLILNILVGQLK